MNMPTMVYLHHKTSKGLTQAEVFQRGGGIASLSFHRRGEKRTTHILDPVAGDYADATSYGSFPLYPAGRIGPEGNGSFRLDGGDERVEPGRHGILRKVEWSILEVGEDQVSLAYELSPNEYPEGFQCTVPMHVKIRQNIRLIEAGVEIEVMVENLGNVCSFANFGFHPYFNVKRPLAVALPARARFLLENDVPVDRPKLLPMSDFWPLKIDTKSQVWDDVFTGLIEDDLCCRSSAVSIGSDKKEGGLTGKGSVYMETCASRDNLGWLSHQIYTPPERPDVIALEPHTTYPNAPYLAEKGFIQMHEAFQYPGEVRKYLVRFGVSS